MTLSAFYGGLYGPGSSSSPKLGDAVSGITASDFNTVILSLFHIGSPANCWTGSGGTKHCQKYGDIVFNNTPDIVATDGAVQSDWVGGSGWADDMNTLKAGGVDKIYLSFGGGSPVVDFTTIAENIMQYEDPGKKTGPYIPTDSNLYENFVALRAYLPMVDGIDLDQEESTDQSTTDAMIAFGNMAVAVGFQEVTLVPPFNFYQDCYQAAGEAINAYAAGMTPPLNGAVTRIGLQLYSGGFEYPSCMTSWAATAQNISAAGGGQCPVLMVGANADGESEHGIYATFNQYTTSYGAGGFIWRYDFIDSSLTCYEQAMTIGLSSGAWPPVSGECG